jgi:hypothetical protein
MNADQLAKLKNLRERIAIAWRNDEGGWLLRDTDIGALDAAIEALEDRSSEPVDAPGL